MPTQVRTIGQLATQTASGLVNNQVAPTSLTASDFTSQTNCTIDVGDVASNICKWAMVNNVVTLWLYVDTFTISGGAASFSFTLPSSIPAPTNTCASALVVYDNSSSSFVLSDVRVSTGRVVTFNKSGGIWTGGSNTNYIRGQISWFTV